MAGQSVLAVYPRQIQELGVTFLSNDSQYFHVEIRELERSLMFLL